jgi:hypothetical protein
MVAFNAAIASGPKYANKLIEKHNGDPYEMLKEHTNFMVNDIPKRDPSQKVFVKGWENRQNDLGNYIQKFASGGEVKHFVAGDYVMDDYGNRVVDESGKTMRNNLNPVTDDYGNKVESKTTPKEKYTNPNNPNRKTVKELVEESRNKNKPAAGGINTLNEQLTGKNPKFKLKPGNSEANTYGGMQDLNYYNELTQKSKEDPNYQPYKDEIAKLLAKNPDLPKQTNTVTPNFIGALSPKNLSGKTKSRDFDYTDSGILSNSSNSNKTTTESLPDYNNDTPYAPSAAGQSLGNLNTAEEAAPNKPDFRDLMQQHLMDSWNKQGKQAEEDKWMSLLSAGLGMMGGTSQHAFTNIGQGAQQGIAAHLAARKAQQSKENSLLSGYGILSKDRYYDAIADRSGTAARLAELTGEKNDRTAAQQGYNAVSANIRALESRKAKLAKDDSTYANAILGMTALKNKKELTKDDVIKLNKYKDTIAEAEGGINQELAGFKQQQASYAKLLGMPSMGEGNEGGGYTHEYVPGKGLMSR